MSEPTTFFERSIALHHVKPVTCSNCTLDAVHVLQIPGAKGALAAYCPSHLARAKTTIDKLGFDTIETMMKS